MIRDSLMDGEMHGSDFGGLCIAESQRPFMARQSAPSCPPIRSAIVNYPLPTNFPAYVVAINGDGFHPTSYDPLANTVECLQETFARILPNVISLALTNTAELVVTVNEMMVQPAPPGVAPDVIQYPISVSQGSSSTGLYDVYCQRFIGLNTRAESD